MASAIGLLKPPEPGSWEWYLAQARTDVARQLGEESIADESAALFTPADVLLAGSDEPTKWLIQGLITEGGIAAIVAEPKSAKSWLALELAASVASGLAAIAGDFGVPHARPTAYFFAEDLAQSVRNRLRAFAAGRGIEPSKLAANLHVQPRGRHLDITRDEDLALVVASCRRIGPIGFLVLDPLRDIQSGKENESDDMSQVFARLRVLEALLGCNVLIVHHAKKPSKDDSDARAGTVIRGSSAIYGSLDGLISLKDLHVDQGELRSVFSNTCQVEVKGAKSAGTFPLVLTVEDGPDLSAVRATWSRYKPIDTSAPSTGDELQFECLEYMATAERLKKPPQTTKEIRAEVGVKKELVEAVLYEAEREGLIVRNWKGKKQRGWTLTHQGKVLLETPNDAEVPPPSTSEPDELPWNLTE